MRYSRLAVLNPLRRGIVLRPRADAGVRLLAGGRGRDLVSAVIAAHGGTLLAARLDHVDCEPGRVTTVTYSCHARWPDRARSEIVGLTSREPGLDETDRRADVFGDGHREVAAWLYPDDPDLPGLARITVAEPACRLLAEYGLLGPPLDPARLALHVVSYRPRRHAVVRVEVDGGAAVYYVKALTARQVNQTVARLDMLSRAQLPVAPLLAVTDENLVVLAALPGRSMAHLLFDQPPAVSGERLVALLDSLPAGLVDMPRRVPWSDAVARYADAIVGLLPAEERRLEMLVERIGSGLLGPTPGDEPTHGDFHEGQIHLSDGQIVGLLDVDACGPGRRVDDLACLLAHLSTVQHMDPVQTGRVAVLRRRLLEVFDHRVDPVELRLRAAGVAISLATGPYRGQEPDWQAETSGIVGAAESLLRDAEVR